MPPFKRAMNKAWETIKVQFGGEAIRSRVQSWYERCFPERREIILRADGRMRYLSVGRRAQAAVAAVAGGLVLWTVIATGGFFLEARWASSERAEYGATLDDKDRQIAAWQEARDLLRLTVESYREENAFVVENLRENEAEVERLSTLNSEMSGKVAELGVNLSDTRVERERVSGARKDLQERLASLEARLREFADEKTVAEARLETVRGLLSSSEAGQDRLGEERDRLEKKLAALRGDVGLLKVTRGNLLDELQQTEARLRVVIADRDRIVEQREGLEDQLTVFRDSVDVLIRTRQQLEARLRTAETDLWAEFENRSRVVFERDQLQDRLAALQAEFEELTRNKNSLSSDLVTTETELTDISQDRDRLARERDRLAGDTEALKNRLTALQASQSNVIKRMGDQAEDSIELVRNAVAITGLDLDQLLARTTRGTGQGGPFVAAVPFDAPGAEMANRLASLESRVEEWQGLQALLSQLPLATPLDGYQLSSPFGLRKDPLTKRAALHSGVDLKGPKRSTIYATAPGRVTFVGWNGGYGKFVEVDHGLGVRTRYGHMDKILVERGQVLEFRDKIGLTGNTGRSTGPHLHYEILVDGRSYNPMSFMRAGQYVFKR